MLHRTFVEDRQIETISKIEEVHAYDADEAINISKRTGFNLLH